MGDSPTDSVFQRAWNNYLENELPKKKSKTNFIMAAEACSNDFTITPEVVNEAMKAAEVKHSERTSRRIVAHLSPVISVLRGYGAILEALASADPMPSALVWAGLKVIIDGLHRYQDLFETIKRSLETLSGQILRITQWQDLYSGDERMQELFYETYIHMIRFWARIDKECSRCSFTSRIRRAAATFSTSKLDNILSDMRTSIERIADQAQIVEANLSKSERRAAAKARADSSKFQKDVQLEQQAAKEHREAQKAIQALAEFDRVVQWLRAVDTQMETDFRRHKDIHERRIVGTCEWLRGDRTYNDWKDGSCSPSVLWIYAPPGAGKSYLCSTIVDSLQSDADESAVAFHFYDFQQMYSADDTLRLLGDQLLRYYWAQTKSIASELLALTQQNPYCQENICDVILFLVSALPKTFILLDGLDEGLSDSGWERSGVKVVLDFVIRLASDCPDKVRVWCSSQYRPYFNETLGGFTTINITDNAQQDVTRFLQAAIDKLDLDVGDQVPFLSNLVSRAGFNFLWASLMIEDLQERATSTATMQEMVYQDQLPTSLDDYYRAILNRIQAHHRSIACMVMFAKRPLRVEELSEAVGILQARDPSSLSTRDLPREKILLNLFAPLIEVKEREALDSTDKICYIFHSTVKDFILAHPDVLSSPSDPSVDLRISHCVPATACLLYLAQSKYAGLLTRDKVSGDWRDINGDSVDSVGHRFLFYTAKYWDKHLDDIDDASTCNNLRSRITSFIRSTNFRTCVQVQSLWVDSQFAVFNLRRMDGRSYLRRVFPSWFVDDDEGRALWEDYRRFLHDWKYFLSCQECAGNSTHTCKVLPCIGDLTRCWWSALGTSNFLAKYEGRFQSFSFQSDIAFEGPTMQTWEGVNVAQNEVFRLSVCGKATSSQSPQELNCDYWSFNSTEAPILRSRYIIHLTENSRDWKIYNNTPEDEKISKEMAPFLAFSNDFQTLRIGTQLYARRGENSFFAIQGAKATGTERHPAYVEEFARRDNIVILASRFRLNNRILEDTETTSDSDDCDDESDSDPEDDYESWSETSSIYSSSDEEQSNSQYDSDESNEGVYSVHHTSDSESDEVSDMGNDAGTVASDSESLDIETEAITGRAEEEEEYECDLGGDIEGETEDQKVYSHAWRTKFRKSKFHHTWASITIMDTSGTNEKTLFTFSRPISFKMYDSPPVIHPFHPLAVWPVGCGDVLFVDFVRDSHFVRRLRPSTYGTRQVFMKCCFSSCGKYLHIVTLEAKKASFWEYRHADRTPIKLAIVVLTFSLSSHKPSRAPPQLIHRVRVPVGTTTSLQPAKLPFTFTWRDDQVYVTCSSTILRVYRVQLFGCKPSSSTMSRPEGDGGLVKHQEPVLRPKKTMFLPESAKHGLVYYSPPTVENEAGKIIVSGGCQLKLRKRELGPENILDMLLFDGPATIFDLRTELRPTVGCYIREQDDLGGWGVCADDVENITEARNSGTLSRRLEKFDPSDDCDLEPYIY
ncbi:NACHT domain-containing protein [Pleurotus pulmonarius]